MTAKVCIRVYAHKGFGEGGMIEWKGDRALIIDDSPMLVVGYTILVFLHRSSKQWPSLEVS